MASVQILPERMMDDPLDGAVPPSHRRLYALDTYQHNNSDDDVTSDRIDKVNF